VGAPRRLELIGGLGVFSKAGCAPEVGIDRRFWGFFSKYEVKYYSKWADPSAPGATLYTLVGGVGL
jgi:hypothetical protein